MRIHAVPQSFSRLADLLDQVAPPTDHPASQVCMSAQIFRARMHHEVDSVFCGMLIDRRAKRAVDHADQPVLPGERRHLLRVDNAQGRIRRRFQIQQLRVRTNGSLILLVFGRVD